MNWTSWWGPRDVQAASAAAIDDAASWSAMHESDCDPRHIKDVLGELLLARRCLSLQLPGGQTPLAATIVQQADHAITLRTETTLPWADNLPRYANLIAPTLKDVVLFSVKLVRQSDGTRLQALQPAELIHLQSRQFHRVRCVRGPTYRIELQLSGAGKNTGPIGLAQMVDLSEGGACVLLDSPGLASPEQPCQATLRLNGEEVHLHHLRVAHCAASKRGLWRVGLQFVNVEPAAARTIRRWVAALETAGSCLA